MMARRARPQTIARASLLTVIAYLALAFLSTPAVDARDKVDAIRLSNGDCITGEIKQLDRGILTVSTDLLGTVSVEWVGVVSIESAQLFEVMDSDGRQIPGSFTRGAEEGELVVVGSDGDTAQLKCSQVVHINQLGRTQWQRLRGNINLGASLTSANNQRDISLDAEATYQNERMRLRNTISGSMSDRDDAEQTSWGTIAANYQRYLSRRWFWYSQLQLDRNEELDLDHRTTIRGGGGRYLLATNTSQLYVSFGVSALREVYIPEDQGDWSSELALTGEYELFLFEGRETSLSCSGSLLPSLSVNGRYRIEYGASLQRKMIRDLSIALNLNGSYDSKPPESSKASDSSFRISFGWSF